MLSPPRGDRGEMAAAAGLGFVADFLRLKKGLHYNACDVNMSMELRAADFLKAVCPQLKDCEKLDNFFIIFTHFYRLGTSPESRILPLLWERHVAIYLPVGE